MAELWLEPYEEGLGEFPVTGTAAQQLAAAVSWATRAPSIHNTQPWIFRVVGEVMEISLDRRRVLRVADPTEREAVISCGAAIEFFHLTLRRFGFDAPIEVVPRNRRASGRLLARIGLGERRRVDPGDRRLFDAIATRVTNRRGYASRPVPEAALERAIRAAQSRQTRVGVLDDTIDRSVLIDFVTAADQAQMASAPFRKELARWLRPLGSRRNDGIPAGSGKGPAPVKPIAPMVVRRFDVGRELAAVDRDLMIASPVLAILWTQSDDRSGWLDAGRGLARLLLSLTADGIATSFLNQPLEIEPSRSELRSLYAVHGDHPQIVVRAGYGPEVAPVPRRPVTDVLRGSSG